MTNINLEKKELLLPNIYMNIPKTQKGHSENNINFNKILNEIPKDEEITNINYEGLRKHYLKLQCNRNKFS